MLAELLATGLSEVNGLASPDRVDTKYLLAWESLPWIIQQLRGEYRVLEIDGRRISRYVTRYFDTPGLALYHAHQAGRMPRRKVRLREYPETGVRFLEIKRKSNKGRTLKERHELAGPQVGESELTGKLAEIFGGESDLEEALRVDYTRIALVSARGRERITFDFDLRCSRHGRVTGFPRAIIAELKQEKEGRSPFRELMRARGIREIELSKYCVGLASLEPGLKQNRFKPAMRRLQRLGDPAAESPNGNQPHEG